MQFPVHAFLSVGHVAGMVEPRGAEFGHNTRGYEDQRWNLNEEGGVHDDGDGDDEYVGGTPERAIGDATQANAPF